MKSNFFSQKQMLGKDKSKGAYPCMKTVAVCLAVHFAGII